MADPPSSGCTGIEVCAAPSPWFQRACQGATIKPYRLPSAERADSPSTTVGENAPTAAPTPGTSSTAAHLSACRRVDTQSQSARPDARWHQQPAASDRLARHRDNEYALRRAPD